MKTVPAGVQRMYESRTEGDSSPSSINRWRSDSNRRSRCSRSRSRSPFRERKGGYPGCRDYSRGKITGESSEKQDRVAMEIQNLAALEVKKYTDSADFKIFVESLKRRERERIMAEVERELWQEKDTLLADGRKKLVTEYLASISSISQQTTLEVIIPEDQLRKLSAAEQVDAILLHNKLKMEEQQRRNYEARQKEDTNRLKQVMYRRHLEEVAERQRLEALEREQALLEEVLQESPVAVATTSPPPRATECAGNHSQLSIGTAVGGIESTLGKGSKHSTRYVHRCR